MIQFMKGTEKEMIVLVSHVVVRWHCFKHKFSRICLDTAGTMCIPFPYSQEHADQKWLLKKEKLGLI